MNNITRIYNPPAVHRLENERQQRLWGQIVCAKQAIRFSRLVYTQKCLNNTSPDRPDGEIQGADIPMWSVIRKQIKDAWRLATQGVFSDQCLNALKIITFQSAKMMFKIQPECPAQQSHRRIQKL